jgi:ubiquinone/menaquinone biosynthesis C-methylase UbiE
MTTAVYDKIGKTYDHTRKADSEIVRRILNHLSPCFSGRYLDIGCGSGNYTEAIFRNGFNIRGIDISEEMLEKARKKHPEIEWIKGDARSLPLPNGIFDGATCILATHHIKDIETAFREAFRVITKGNFVIFTSFPEQIENFWLNEYFPNLMKKASTVMHRNEEIFTALKAAGFKNIKTDKFFVSNDLQDWFLHAGKYRPHIYLDPMVRSGISTFALEANQEEIVKGLESLKQDIASGKIDQIIQSYENDLADYTFVISQKE